MVHLFNQMNLGAHAQQADMRRLRLGREFDAILAWNSFFHMSHRDQASLFEVSRAHAAPRAFLVFSTGHKFGEGDGSPVCHASFAPLQYRRMLRDAGFRVLRFFPEDDRLNRHNWWLCRRA